MIARVVGLDLSITSTGVTWRDGATETIATRSADGDWRLCFIRDQLTTALAPDELPPQTKRTDLVVIEEIPPVRAHAIAKSGMVHGVVRDLLIRLGIPYALVPPSSLKKYATGRGNANKTQMAVAAQKRFGLEFDDDNQCDAFWLRAMGLDALGFELIAMPLVSREALVKVAWPKVAL